MIGCTMHIFQICIVIFYVNLIYINNSLPPADDSGKQDNPYALVLLGGIIYPFFYCMTMMIRYGLEDFFTSPSNYLDMAYILGSVA